MLEKSSVCVLHVCVKFLVMYSDNIDRLLRKEAK